MNKILTTLLCFVIFVSCTDKKTTPEVLGYLPSMGLNMDEYISRFDAVPGLKMNIFYEDKDIQLKMLHINHYGKDYVLTICQEDSLVVHRLRDFSLYKYGPISFYEKKFSTSVSDISGKNIFKALQTSGRIYVSYNGKQKQVYDVKEANKGNYPYTKKEE